MKEQRGYQKKTKISEQKNFKKPHIKVLYKVIQKNIYSISYNPSNSLSNFIISTYLLSSPGVLHYLEKFCPFTFFVCYYSAGDETQGKSSIIELSPHTFSIFYARFYTVAHKNQEGPFGFHCSLKDLGLCMQQYPHWGYI